MQSASLPTIQLRSGRQSDGFFRHPSNKKAGISAGPVCWRSPGGKRSVSSDARAAVTAEAVTAEAVVEAHGDHIHVLADVIVEKSGPNRIDDRERIVRVTHEQMVVFDTHGPIRREAILDSDTHGATPAGRACRGKFKAGKGVEDAEPIAGHRRAALEVEQRRVPGVADLAGEQADAIGFGAGRESRVDQADARVAEIRPIALSFQTEHPVAGLPAVADLAAGDASGSIAATVSEVKASHIKEIHTVAALSPAAIAADIEPGPVVNRGHHRGRRLVVRTWRQISSRRGSGHAQGHYSNRSEQKLLHY